MLVQEQKKGRAEVSLAAFSFLFSEIVQQAQVIFTAKFDSIRNNDGIRVG